VFLALNVEREERVREKREEERERRSGNERKIGTPLFISNTEPVRFA